MMNCRAKFNLIDSRVTELQFTEYRFLIAYNGAKVEELILNDTQIRISPKI